MNTQTHCYVQLNTAVICVYGVHTNAYTMYTEKEIDTVQAR